MTIELPTSIDAAVDHVIRLLTAEQRATIASLQRDEVERALHHGLGTWIRNTLIHPGNPRLAADCDAILRAEAAARVAGDPALSAAAAKLEALRAPFGSDDYSGVIVRRVWERLAPSG